MGNHYRIRRSRSAPLRSPVAPSCSLAAVPCSVTCLIKAALLPVLDERQPLIIRSGYIIYIYILSTVSGIIIWPCSLLLLCPVLLLAGPCFLACLPFTLAQGLDLHCTACMINLNLLKDQD